jgi:hypothetical protein
MDRRYWDKARRVGQSPALSKTHEPMTHHAVLPRIARWSVSFVIIAIVFLPKFGVRITADFSVSFALLSLYIYLLVSFLRSSLSMNLTHFALFALLLVSGVVSILENRGNDISIQSFILLAVIYAPMIFKAAASTRSNILYSYALKKYLTCTYIIAIIAISQFLIQFVYSSPWIFDFTKITPQSITASGFWNSTIPVWGYHKANGFFLREPSELSSTMAFAILVEYFNGRRPKRFLVYGTALFLSFSGTGIFILGAAYLLFTGIKSFSRSILFLCLGTLAFFVVDTYAVDGYYTTRLKTFSSPGSSAYARFVAPTGVVSKGASDSLKLLFGNGPGSYRPMTDVYSQRLGWEIHDPTWAKLLVEYGLIGTAFAVSLLLCALSRGPGIPELKFGLMYAWLAAGGELLQPEFVFLLYILVAHWPRSAQSLRYDTGFKIRTAPRPHRQLDADADFWNDRQ